MNNKQGTYYMQIKKKETGRKRKRFHFSYPED